MNLEFPAPTQPWSLNEERSQHWGWKATRVKKWREAAGWAWKQAHRHVITLRPALGPCRVTVYLPVYPPRLRDPHNWIPPVKAIVDGLVAVGAWPDDTPEWVTVSEPVLELRKDTTVRVTLEEM